MKYCAPEREEAYAKSKELPKSVNEAAAKAAEGLAANLAAKCVAKQTVDDGVLSEGKIKPPATQKKTGKPGLPKAKQII